MPIQNETITSALASGIQDKINNLQSKSQEKIDRLAKSNANTFVSNPDAVNYMSAEDLQYKLGYDLGERIYTDENTGKKYQYRLDPDGTYAHDANGDWIKDEYTKTNKWGSLDTENLYIDDTKDGNYKLGLARNDIREGLMSPWTNKQLTPYEARYLDKRNLDAYVGGGRKFYDGTPGPMGVTPEDGALIDVELPGTLAHNLEHIVHTNAGQLASRAVGQGPLTLEDEANFGGGKTEYTTSDAPMWNANYDVSKAQVAADTPLPLTKLVDENSAGKTSLLDMPEYNDTTFTGRIKNAGKALAFRAAEGIAQTADLIPEAYEYATTDKKWSEVEGMYDEEASNKFQEWIGYNETAMNELGQKAQNAVLKAYDEGDWTGVVSTLWDAAKTPELLGESLGFVVGMILPGGVVKGAVQSASGVNKAAKAMMAADKTLSKADAIRKAEESAGLGYKIIKNTAGQAGYANYAEQVAREAEVEYKKLYGEEMPADRRAGAFALGLISANMDAMMAKMLIIGKDPVSRAMKKALVESTPGVKKSVVRKLSEATGIAATRLLGAMGEESVTEGIQSALETTAGQYKDGNLGEVLTSRENVGKIGSEALLGAAGGAQFSGANIGFPAATSILDAVSTASDGVTEKIKEYKSEQAPASKSTLDDTSDEDIADLRVTDEERAFVKSAGQGYKDVLSGKKTVDEHLDDLTKAEDILDRLSSEEGANKDGIKKAKAVVAGLKQSALALVEETNSTNVPVLGSSEKAEELIMLALEDAKTKNLSETAAKRLDTKLELIAETNKISKERFADIKRDMASVEEEVSEGKRSYNSYFRETKRLLTEDNPNQAKIRKNIRGLQRIADTTELAVKAWKANMAAAEAAADKANRSGVAPANIGSTGKAAMKFSYETASGKTQSHTLYLEEVGGKWQVTQANKDVLVAKENTLRNTKAQIKELGTAAGIKTGTKASNFGVETDFNVPENMHQADSYKGLGITKLFMGVKPNKKGTTLEEVNPENTYSHLDGSVKITKNDVILISESTLLHQAKNNKNGTPGGFRFTKEMKALVDKAKKAGATLVFDYSHMKDGEAINKLKKRLGNQIGKTYAKVDTASGSTAVFKPAEEAEVVNAKVKADKEAAETREKNLKLYAKTVHTYRSYASGKDAENTAKYKEKTAELKKKVLKYFPDGKDKTAAEKLEAYVERYKSDIIAEHVNYYKKNGVTMDSYSKLIVPFQEEIDRQIQIYDDARSSSSEILEEYKAALEKARGTATQKGDTTDLEIFEYERLDENGNPLASDRKFMNDVLETSSSKGKPEAYMWYTTTKDGTKKKHTSHDKPENYKELEEFTVLPLDPNSIVSVSRSTALNSINSMLYGTDIDELLDPYIEKLTKLFKTTKGQNKGLKQKTLDYASIDSTGRGLLFNKDGEVNRNVALAMMLSVMEQIAFNSNMLKPGYKTNDDLKTMLGIESVRKGTLELIGNKGMLMTTFIDNVRKGIASQLGVSGVKDGVDRNAFPRMMADLANMAAIAMASDGKLEFDSVPGGEYAKTVLGKEITGEDKAEVRFVRIAGNRDTYKDVADVVAKEFEMVSEILPVENTVRKEPNYQKPSKAAIDKKVTSIRKEKAGIVPPKVSQDVLRDLMNTTWHGSIRMVDRILGYKNAKELLGWVDLTNDDAIANMTYKQIDVQESINRDIEKGLAELEQLKNRGDITDGVVEMWFDYFFSKNGRYFIDSNTINPQTSKHIFRYVVQPADHKGTYRLEEVNGKIKVFATDWAGKKKGEADKDVTRQMEFAIAQGTGFGIDKKLTKSVSENAQALLRAAFEKDTEKIKELEAKLMTEGKYQYTLSEEEEYDYEIEHFGHAVQTIMLLEDWAQGKPATSYITAEYDAVTSGFAHKLLQLPILLNAEGKERLKTTLAYLSKVGLLTKEHVKNILEINPDIEISMNDFLDGSTKNGIVDNYVTLATDVEVQTSDKLEGLLKSKNEGKKYKVLLGINKNTEGFWNEIREVLPQKEVKEKSEAVVSKTLRNLFKYPFMIFNYAASIATIRRNLASDLVDDVLSGVMKYKKDMAKDDENYKKNEGYKKAVNKLLRFEPSYTNDKGTHKITSIEQLQEAVRTVPANKISIRNAGMSETKSNLQDYLAELMDITYGAQVDNIMNTKFGPYVEAQKTVNKAFKAMFQAYKVDYEEAKAKVKAEKGEISDNDYVKIIKDLQAKFPAIKGPFSEGDDDVIGVYKTKNVAGTSIDSTVGTHVNKEAAKNIDGVDGDTSTVKIKIKDFEESMSAGSVVPIHYLDGSLIADIVNAMSNIGMTLVHDAVMPPLFMTNEVVQSYNKSYLERNREYSVIGAIADKMESVLKGLTDKHNVKIEVKGDDGKTVTMTVREYVNEAVAEVNELNGRVQEARTEIFKVIDEGAYVMHGAGTPESVYAHNIGKEETKQTDGTMSKNKSSGAASSTVMENAEKALDDGCI